MNPITVAPVTTPAITPAFRAAAALNCGAKLGRMVPTDSGEPPKAQAETLFQGAEVVTFRNAQAGTRVELDIDCGNVDIGAFELQLAVQSSYDNQVPF
jgi:hypothetical protein